MQTTQSLRIENSADLLSGKLCHSSAPVDLFAIARHRRVKQLGLRFIVPRGVLLPTRGGFEVYLRDTVRKDIDISEAEPDGLLSSRQRFSLAHEIAHTYFYKFSDDIPAPGNAVGNELELEKACDRTAGHILVPSATLKWEIKRKIGDYAGIDSDFILKAAAKFRTSLEVLIDRLSIVESSNPFERCVLLVRRRNTGAEIRACYFGVGLLPILPRPVKYTKLTDWLPGFPRRKVEGSGDVDWHVTHGCRHLTFMKRSAGTGADFLLQVQTAEVQVR